MDHERDAEKLSKGHHRACTELSTELQDLLIRHSAWVRNSLFVLASLPKPSKLVTSRYADEKKMFFFYFTLIGNQPNLSIFSQTDNVGRLVVILLNGQRLEVTCDPQKITAGQLFQVSWLNLLLIKTSRYWMCRFKEV